MFYARLLLLLSATLFAGCSLIPASHLKVSGNWEKTDQEAVDLDKLVRFTPITSAIFSQADEPALEVSADLAETQQDYDYQIGIGDVLQITVWDHPELTIPAGSMRSPSDSGNWVHNDGTIFYPYVGKLEVVGLRITELRDLLTEKLATYIQSPQVDVTVAAFRSQRVYVTGEVRQPGAYPVTNVPLRVLDAVNAAGGTLETADWTKVVLTRNGQEYNLSLRALFQQGNPEHNVLLQPGDVLHVNRNDDSKVFVLGEVRAPKVVPMGRNGLTLAEALAVSEGLVLDNADASGIFVLRNNPEDTEKPISVYQLNAKSAMALVMADQFHLDSRDVVYVTTAPIARWNRVIRNLLPTFQTIYYGALSTRQIQQVNE